MAKAIVSGDSRLMQKAGPEAEIARLERLEAARIDDQHAIRGRFAKRRMADVREDIEWHLPTAAGAVKMTVGSVAYNERKLAGHALMKGS